MEHPIANSSSIIMDTETDTDSSHFSNLPTREPVDIEFRNISLAVKSGLRRECKEILHNISGQFSGGQLIAIMGPSGAGKSTLLDVLSGYKTTGVEGSISLNKRPLDLSEFRRMSCYITQDNCLQALLTVNENMRIAADLKLGSNVSTDMKKTRIKDILMLLGLYEHGQTRTKSLSGGQKKRLSIAMELVNNPTVMFLDEPTTGLDSSVCTKVLELCKNLTRHGRTIVCTIHQPSAKLFQIFDHVYVLAGGNCIYQGGTEMMVHFLHANYLTCPRYHNPADFIIELACGEYGLDKLDVLKSAAENGSSIDWFNQSTNTISCSDIVHNNRLLPSKMQKSGMEYTGFLNQLAALLRRGYISSKRNTTLTHLRIFVNVIVAIMLGALYANSGKEGSRVMDNYKLLFSMLIHNSMVTMMLTVLTFPMEMPTVIKEHFNQWYSLKAYYMSITLLDLPISIFGTLLFTNIIYFSSGQPMEWNRYMMFLAISVLVVLAGQSLGLMIGAWFNVVNGTFVAPVVTVPMMMFSGFGIPLQDLPFYLKWGTYVSQLRYGLEGYVGAIYGNNRECLNCNEARYCHYKYPKKFLSDITMEDGQFWNDVIALILIIMVYRIAAYVILRSKINSLK
ncbi:ATP-binding cassette sub-family G member 1-like [Musca vetustissima]|uniref:ATP-binding cassette sub-family G member 1-like n=1 Tax=Musca vetustissima TaxID=27455 RepID=UPI002AB654F4|nr:ATP-binding cassette sub-family G member 1-like [Musca vetustissima]